MSALTLIIFDTLVRDGSFHEVSDDMMNENGQLTKKVYDGVLADALSCVMKYRSVIDA
jgi:hypothetical protein